MPESRGRLALWSLFGKRGGMEERNPFYRKNGFLSSIKFTSFSKLIPPKVLGDTIIY
jgi:hypothetical protein